MHDGEKCLVCLVPQAMPPGLRRIPRHQPKRNRLVSLGGGGLTHFLQVSQHSQLCAAEGWLDLAWLLEVLQKFPELGCRGFHFFPYFVESRAGNTKRPSQNRPTVNDR